jgi:hypothetical protein
MEVCSCRTRPSEGTKTKAGALEGMMRDFVKEKKLKINKQLTIQT